MDNCAYYETFRLSSDDEDNLTIFYGPIFLGISLAKRYSAKIMCSRPVIWPGPAIKLPECSLHKLIVVHVPIYVVLFPHTLYPSAETINWSIHLPVPKIIPYLYCISWKKSNIVSDIQYVPILSKLFSLFRPLDFKFIDQLFPFMPQNNFISLISSIPLSPSRRQGVGKENNFFYLISDSKSCS